jgi:hypothetical protein
MFTDAPSTDLVQETGVLAALICPGAVTKYKLTVTLPSDTQVAPPEGTLNWQLEMGLLLLGRRVKKPVHPSVAAQALAHIRKAAAASAPGGISAGSPSMKPHNAPPIVLARKLP